MSINKVYDVCITGGGLAGLSLSILLSKKGYSVALFEKEKYPFHRVCGEYISNECRSFLISLGIDLESMHLPSINNLQVSSPNGTLLESSLLPGGFGISRYKLDKELSDIAKNNHVEVYENSKVSDVKFEEGTFRTITNHATVQSKLAIASFGKRSNLDIKWKRKFIEKKASKLNNYIGVKYHITGNFSDNTIGLHNFQDGYCGISKIENDQYCLCYLTTAENLKRSSNSIKKMELDILCRNRFLKNIFVNSIMKFHEPVTISQISFDKKNIVENEILMLGDAAGLITPLCGNGMSMAFRSAQMASLVIDSFLQNQISLKEMQIKYQNSWENEFSVRLKTGRIIQSFFGKPVTTNIFISLMKKLPFLTKKLIALTHGKNF